MRKRAVSCGVLAVVGGLLVGFSSNAFWPSSAPKVLAADNDLSLDPTSQVTAMTKWEAMLAPAPLTRVTRAVVVKSGDNLMNLLTQVGADRQDAHTAIQSLKGVYDPRRDLRIGHRVLITFSPTEQSTEVLELARLKLPVAFDRDVAVERDKDGAFRAQEVVKTLEMRLVRASGTIETSLFQDGRLAGIPAPVLVDMIQIYSFDVDFQRELREGDRFEILFERFFDERGRQVHDGEVAYANLTLRDKPLPLYRYTSAKGNTDYFNPDGQSVRKALMRTPIDGARLSSGFGKRKHPILGYTRMHAGLDFAAPSGTPIYAAGNGRIEAIGTNGGYGRYIRIRHNDTFQTAYAHMKGYARGLNKGARVRQGQIIGFVGTTGRSTGPHLHYEVIKDGKKINPKKLKLPSGEKLAGAELDVFQKHRAEIDVRNDELARQFQVAGKPKAK